MTDAADARLIVITGIMASGKSTVAERLANELPACVHLKGDVFRRMIVNGREDMTRNPSPVAIAQLKLRYHIAANVAREYLAAGFSVVHQDIILGGMLADVAADYQRENLHVVVLCPDVETVTLREAGREKKGYRDTFSVANLDEVLRTQTPRVGLWLDTSTLSVGESVERILTGLDDARIA